ncbi:RNA polymerase sigma factor [Arthrobacter sp. SA17]
MMLSEATPGAEPAEPSDAELIAKVRAGEWDAYGQLFGRHHRAAVGLAHRYARNGSDAEDLAAEGFANVLAALQSGSGPDAFFGLTSFRPLPGWLPGRTLETAGRP